MLIINAKKFSPSQIVFEFQGPAAHIEVARTALEKGTISERIEAPSTSLIASVSPELLKAITSLSLIETVDGTPFVPLFLPEFGNRSEISDRQTSIDCL